MTPIPQSSFSKNTLDGRIGQYVADLWKKAKKLYVNGRRVLLTTTVQGGPNTAGRKHVMRVFWCLSFGSVPHHRGVTFPASSSKQTRPDCVTLLSIQILILLLSPSSDPNIILRAASGHSIHSWYNVLLTQGTDTLMQCWMINIYISDRYSMSSPPSIFRLCLYLCVIARPATAADEDQIVKNGTLREQRNQVGPI